MDKSARMGHHLFAIETMVTFDSFRAAELVNYLLRRSGEAQSLPIFVSEEIDDMSSGIGDLQCQIFLGNCD